MKMGGMKNEEGWLKCVMLNCSAWSIDKAFLERRGSEPDVFIGIEQRLRGEAVDQERTAYARKFKRTKRQVRAAPKKPKMGSALREVMIADKKRSGFGGSHCWRQSGRFGTKRGFYCS